MSGTDHDRRRDDVAAYMLGALEPEEAAELERHVEGCERCRSEMRWLTPAVQALPEAVERLEPPPGLRQRVTEEVEAHGAGMEPLAASAAAGSRRRSPARSGFRRLSPGGWLGGLRSGSLDWRPVAAMAAVALAVVAVAGYEIGSGGGAGGLEPAPETIVAGHAPGVVAKVVSGRRHGWIQLENVRQLPGDRVLEAWVRRNGKIEPVPALFVPDRAGRAGSELPGMAGVDTVMVTAEPRGGTDAPTSAPIVTVPIQ